MDEKTIEFRRRMNDVKAPDRAKIELQHARDLGLSLSPEHLVYSARPKQATTKIESDLHPAQVDVANWGGVDLDYRLADKTFLTAFGVEEQQTGACVREAIERLAGLSGADSYAQMADLAYTVQSNLDLIGNAKSSAEIANKADKAFAKAFFSNVNAKDSGTAPNSREGKAK